jgi:predicted PurR-regulated permease PerM
MTQPLLAEVPATAGKSQPLRWPARRFVLAVVTGVGLYFCFLLSVPLLPALTWALSIAVLAWPLHHWMRARVKNGSVAASLSVVAVTLILVVPAVLVMIQLGKELQTTVERMKEFSENGGFRAKMEQNPTLAPFVGWVEQYVDVKAETRRLAESLTGGAAGVARTSVEVFALILITLFTLFYFFRDRDVFLGEVHALAPLSRPETERLRKRVRDTVEATLYGRLLVAAIQGALGGLMFWWLGLSAPVLWGVVMGFLSVIPVLGSFCVWIPVALFFALNGEWGKAAILTAWGAIVIGLIDNLLYPILVGNKLRLHSLVVFVSLLGGLAVFGAAGVVLGPVVVSLTDGLLDLWRRPSEDDAIPSGSLLLPK